VPGDRFVIRLHSPMITIGGGEVIDLSKHRLKQGKPQVIERLLSKESAIGSPRQLALNALEERGYEAMTEKEAARASGLPPEEVQAIFRALLEEGVLFASSRAGHYISTKRFEEAKAKARSSAQEFFRLHPRRLLMERVVLRQAIPGHEAFFLDLLAALEKEGAARPVRGEFIEWPFHRPRLAPEESRFRDRLLEAMRAGSLSPPRAEEVAAAERLDPKRAAAIADLLIEEGELVKAAEDVLFHREALEEARRRLREHLEKAGAMTASEARNLLATSRKYIIPLLELLDREGFTIRRGDLRELRKPIQ
jgi:selenocysteine-specific elongation factor